MTEQVKPKILIVEDEVITAMDLEDRLSAFGFEPVGKAANAQIAFKLIEKTAPDLVLMDIRLQGETDGITAAKIVKEQYGIPVIFLTAYPEESTFPGVKDVEPYGYLIKPYDDRLLKLTIETALLRKKYEKEIKTLNKLYHFISQVNQAIVRNKTRQELLSAICRIAVEIGGYKLAWIGLIDELTKMVLPVASAGDAEGYLEKLQIVLNGKPEQIGLTATALKNKRPYISRDYLCDPQLKPWWNLASAKGFGSAAAFPLTGRNKVYGALMLYSGDPELFSEKEVKLLEEIASDISYALDQFEEIRARKAAESALEESERFNTQIVNSANDGILVVDKSFKIKLWNPAMEKITGLRTSEVINRSLLESFLCTEEHGFLDILNEVLIGKEIEPIEHKYDIAATGKKGWASITFTALKNKDGEITGILAIVRDITAHKKLELERELLFNLCPDLLSVIGFDGYLKQVNPAWQKILGWATAELLSKPLIELVYPSYRKDFLRYFENLKSGRILPPFDSALKCKDGSIRWISLNTYPLYEEKLIFAVARDVTDKHLAEEQLLNSYALYSSLVESLEQCVFRKDLNGRFTFANQRFCKSLGTDLANIIGKTDFDFYPEELAKKYRNDDRKVIQTGETLDLIEENKPPGGEKTYVRVVKTPLRDASGKIIGVQGIFWDITKERQMEESLRLQSVAIESAATGIMITDPDGKILYANKALCNMSGFSSEEILGKTPSIFKSEQQDPAVYKNLWETIKTGKIWRGELLNKRKDGEHYTVELTITPITNSSGEITHYVCIQEDITIKKQMDANLRHSQKMQSITTLAGGLAHDINNALTPIVISVEMLKEEMPGPTARGLLDTISKCAHRSAELIKQVLAFGRAIEMRKTLLHPSKPIIQVYNAIKQTFPKSITIVFDIDQDVWQIYADPGYMSRTLMNLCLNSRDAMLNGGFLKLSAKNYVVDEEFARKNPEAKPGNYVLFKVIDTGTGIKPEHLDKIFDPFFTTKDVGKGVGLGLSVAHSIVKSHDGFMSVQSKVNEGTTVNIFIPAVVSEHCKTYPEQERIKKGRGECILIIEDTPAMLNTLQTALETSNYHPVVAENFETAVEKFKLHKNEISLVISDLILPVVKTVDTLKKMKSEKPELKIIVTYNADLADRIDEVVKSGFSNILQKPYPAWVLMDLIDNFLHPITE